jgi:hypothetical protein
MTAPASEQVQRQTYTVRDLAALTGRDAGTVRNLIAKNGSYLGVKPLVDTGQRIKLFPAARIDAVLRGES